MPPPGTPLGSEELLAHAGFLRALARGLCADEARADDLVQDTYVAALERPPAERGALRGWLATVARHLAANRARSEARRTQREPLAARPESHPPEHATLERLELSRRLAEAVLDLGEPYRTAIYLRYHEGLAPQAIAARQGVPVKTVKTRLARALAELRQRMDERAGGRGAWMPALLALAWPRGSVPAAAAPLAVTLAGGLAVKKLALAAVVVALLAVTWVVARVELASPRAAKGASASPALAHSARVEQAAPIERATPVSAPREPLPQIVPEAPETTGDLTVDVVWQDGGGPIAGLCVDVLCLEDRAPRRRRAHALTGSDGVARFFDLPPGSARVFASTGSAEDAQVIAGLESRVRLEVFPGFTVDGRVVDPQRAPVANAEIWVQHGGQTEWNHAVARSGADGRFTLRGLTEGVAFGARAAGWRPSLMFEASELPLGPNGARAVTLELGAPGGGVAGRVLDPDGEPAADALVLVGDPGGFIVDLPTGLRATSPRPALIAADERGEFALLDHLEPGAHDVHVCAHGFPIWSGSVEVAQGSKAWLDVQLAPPARIAGRVMDDQGAPVPDAEVVSSREVGVEQFTDPFKPPRTTSDAQGLFQLDWVAPGEQELSARVPGNERLGRARASVTIEPGETREVELALDVGAAIRGRVVDGEGRPLAGWSVYGKSSGMVEDARAGVIRFLDLRRQDKTDAQGRFVLANPIHPGASQRNPMALTVAAPGQIPIPPRAELAGVMPGTADVELVVENAETAPAILRGRLVNADGRAPRDVMLTVWEQGGNAGLLADVDPATGRFEFASTLPGHFEVRVMRGGNTLTSSGPHELLAGQTTDIGQIELATPGHVEVSFPACPPNSPSTRVNLTASWAADEELERAGDSDSYRSRPVAPGTWVLHVDCESWFVPDRDVEVQSGATARLELEGVPAFEVDLAFEVADPSAKWSRVEVEIRDAADAVVRRGGPWPPERLHAGVLKLYRLSLPAGRFSAHARTDGGQEGFGTLEITDPLSARGPHRFPLR